MEEPAFKLPAPDSQPYAPSEPPKSQTEQPVAAPQPQQPTAQPPLQQPAPVEIDYSKPVAYDQAGRPLYAHPPQSAPATPALQPAPAQPVAAEPADVPSEPAAANPDFPAEDDPRQRHQESLLKYPNLNLSDGEYVIASVPRDAIGLMQIWVVAILVFAAVGGFVAAFLYGQEVSDTTRVAAATAVAIVGLLAVAGAVAFSKIYQGNKLYLTNESIIQETQTSLIAKREQTVSLGGVEDVSYKQTGYLASLFNFGTLHMTTEGEETNYRFAHVDNPKKYAAIINNAIEEFSSGREND